MAMGSDVFRAGLRQQKTKGYDRAIEQREAKEAKQRKARLAGAIVGFRGKTPLQWIHKAQKEGVMLPIDISHYLYTCHSVWIAEMTVAQLLAETIETERV
jgi:hypothetical protein